MRWLGEGPVNGDPRKAFLLVDNIMHNWMLVTVCHEEEEACEMRPYLMILHLL